MRGFPFSKTFLDKLSCLTCRYVDNKEKWFVVLPAMVLILINNLIIIELINIIIIFG